MENVPSRTAAAELIDFAKRCADNSTWVYNTINRVQEGGSDAQAQSTGDPSGDPNQPLDNLKRPLAIRRSHW